MSNPPKRTYPPASRGIVTRPAQVNIAPTTSPTISRTPIQRVPDTSPGITGTIKARPYGGAVNGTFGRNSGGFAVRPGATGSDGHGRNSNPSIRLGFDGGDLRYGSISRGGHGRYSGGGFIRLYDDDHDGHHRPHSTYGQLYHDHRRYFYGPYRSYWSTAYYPYYEPVYWPAYDNCYPRYGYSFSSVYLGTPRVVEVYADTPYAVANTVETQEYPVVEEAAVGAAGFVEPDAYVGSPQHTVPVAGAQPGVVEGQVVPQQPSASETADGWGPVLGQGNVAFSQAQFEDARRIYAQAMLIDERDGYAKMLYAWANFALGDYELAATAMRRALLTAPDLTRYPIDIRLHYGDLSLLEKQTEVLAAYVGANPGDREAKLVLAYLHYSTGDLARALTMFHNLALGDQNDKTVLDLRDAATEAAKVILNGEDSSD